MRCSSFLSVGAGVCISGGQLGMGSCEDTCCVFVNRPNKIRDFCK